MILLMLLNILWVTGACFTLTFNCPIQISKFFHKTSPVRCPLPAKLIKSVDIEKKFSVDKNIILVIEGTDYISFEKKNENFLIRVRTNFLHFLNFVLVFLHVLIHAIMQRKNFSWGGGYPLLTTKTLKIPIILNKFMIFF